MTKEFKAFLSSIGPIVCGVSIGIIWGIVFALPSILLFAPSLGHSWKWWRIGQSFLDRLASAFLTLEYPTEEHWGFLTLECPNREGQNIM